MSVARQAIAARRKARHDPRYPQNKKDDAVRGRKLREKVAAEQKRKLSIQAAKQKRKA